MSNFKKYTQPKSQRNKKIKELKGRRFTKKNVNKNFNNKFVKQNFSQRKIESDKSVLICGKNVVYEALLNKPECIERIYIEKTKFTDEKILSILNNQKTSRNSGKLIPVERIDGTSFPKEIQMQNNQNIFAKIDISLITKNFKEFENSETLTLIKEKNKGCVIILGELEDVTNVGSIIRSASAFGISAILIPENNQVQINETIIKISAGQAFNIDLIKIGNVNDVIKKLKEIGFWIYGLDMSGDKLIHEEKFDSPTAFIIGNEGEGLRESFLKNSDIVLKIPMSEKCESLNASISTAIAMYEWKKQNN